jgi:hypothetical protein
MDSFRLRLLVTGVLGLLACAGLAGLASGLVATGLLRPPLPYRPLTVALVVILGGFSLVEVPLMVFTLRRLAMERSGNEGAVLGLHALYVCFAGVYGAPVPLLTGNLTWGLILSALAMPRLIASLLFVRGPRP